MMVLFDLLSPHSSVNASVKAIDCEHRLSSPLAVIPINALDMNSSRPLCRQTKGRARVLRHKRRGDRRCCRRTSRTTLGPCGVLFSAYMQQLSSTKDDHNQQQGNTNATALVLLNTRGLGGYKSIEEMVKPKSEMPWGNRFTFLPVSIPKLTGGVTDDHANLNPLRFVKEAHWIIKRKRNSAVVYLTGWILEILRKFRGREVATGSGVVVEKWWWYGETMATMLTVVKRRQRWMALCDDSSEGLCSRGGEEVS
ncbi:hypothetical protein C3L33_23266, partial [Rhododendron williamsianum]